MLRRRPCRLTRMAGGTTCRARFPRPPISMPRGPDPRPPLGEAWYVLTVALFEAGRADEALDACRESVKHAPDARPSAERIGSASKRCWDADGSAGGRTADRR